MRTTLNKHLLEAFNLRESDSKRVRKPYRITSSLQNISADIDAKATVLMKQYNNLRSESSGRKLDDPNRKFKHRNCSARGDSIRQSLNYRDEIKRKETSFISRKLSEECFPFTVKVKKRSPSESRANMDTKVSSLDHLDSKNSTDRLHEKVKEMLGRTEDKTFDNILESFDNDISKVKTKVNEDHSFNYRVLRLTETGSLDQEVKNLEERNIKKEVTKKKLRMVIRSKPQNKIDKILSQINILDDNLCIKYGGKGLNATTLSVRTGGQSTAKGPFSMNDLSRDNGNENITMTMQEMKNKLKEYGTIFHKQISAFKDSGMYPNFKQKEEIRKEIKEADWNLGINGRKRKLLVRKKFADTIRKILIKMKKLRLNMNNIIKDNAISTKPFQRPASETFIKAAKDNDYSTIFEFLLWDEFLVHDFDPTRQTALHWATKRNFTKIMKLLLEKGADPDAKDIMGRTPLFIAAKNANKTCVKLLLQFGANPLIRSDAHKRPIDYTYDFDVTHLLKRAAQIHIIMNIYPWKPYLNMWKNFSKGQFNLWN